MNRKSIVGVVLGALAIASTASYAREPGVLPPMAPGGTMGIPIAAPLPDGFFFSSRSAYTDLEYHDANGKGTGVDIVIPDTAVVFNYVPGKELFGGQYRASVALPLVRVELSGNASGSTTGFGSLDIHPLDISWSVADGIFVNAGVSVLAPGEWSATESPNSGQNFWSLSPSVGYSYLRNGRNATAHLIYTTNQRNTENNYKSGDEVLLHLTGMKDIGKGLSLGPVGYLRRQVSDDSNQGDAYGGGVVDRSEATGVGVSVTKLIGKVIVNGMYTQDVDAVESGGGSRIWINFALPL